MKMLNFTKDRRKRRLCICGSRRRHEKRPSARSESHAVEPQQRVEEQVGRVREATTGTAPGANDRGKKAPLPHHRVGRRLSLEFSRKLITPLAKHPDSSLHQEEHEPREIFIEFKISTYPEMQHLPSETIHRRPKSLPGCCIPATRACREIAQMRRSDDPFPHIAGRPLGVNTWVCPLRDAKQGHSCRNAWMLR